MKVTRPLQPVTLPQ